MNARVCIVYVEKLPDDKKYVLYDSEAYERKLSGDHRIAKVNIEKQKELRAELELAHELRKVENATLAHIDIDKLNDFIQQLNQGMKIETLKHDIHSALPFLERKKFVLNKCTTLL